MSTFPYPVVGIQPQADGDPIEYDIAFARTGAGAIAVGNALLRRFANQTELTIYVPDMEADLTHWSARNSDEGDDALRDALEAISNVLDEARFAIEKIGQIQGCAKLLSSQEKERIAKTLLAEMRSQFAPLSANRSTSGEELGAFIDVLSEAEARAKEEPA